MMRRVVVLVGVVAVFAVAWAGSASAHVTISGSATKGGYATFSFKVPNEKDDAVTNQLKVQFPQDHPLASVSVQPVPGWTATVEKAKLATPIKTDDGEITEGVSTITWSGGQIKPGEFQQFPVSAGPMPDDADSLTFKALQTYSDGDVVRWVEETTPGGPEPEHPAPKLTLTAASGSAAPATTTADTSTGKLTVGQLPGNVAMTSDVDSARTVGIVGIVIGAVGIGAAAIAIARTRRSKPSEG